MQQSLCLYTEYKPPFTNWEWSIAEAMDNVREISLSHQQIICTYNIRSFISRKFESFSTLYLQDLRALGKPNLEHANNGCTQLTSRTKATNRHSGQVGRHSTKTESPNNEKSLDSNYWHNPHIWCRFHSFVHICYHSFSSTMYEFANNDQVGKQR